MMNMDIDKICFVIIKARAFDAQELGEDEDEGSDAADNGFRGVLLTHADDAIEEELTSWIDSMNVDEQARLVALTWMGWGIAMGGTRHSLAGRLPGGRPGPVQSVLQRRSV